MLAWGPTGTFGIPYYIALDADGNVYVTDPGTHAEQALKFDSNGSLISKWGVPGTADTELIGATGIVVDHDGDILIAEGWDAFQVGQGGMDIKKFSYSTTPTKRTSWGAMKRRFR